MAASETHQDTEYYVEVDSLVTRFFTQRGIVKALDNVSFGIKKGEIFGLVGESGCGKSVTATSLLDLIPDPPGRIIRGRIVIDGFNILSDTEKLARIKVKSETSVKIKRNKRLAKRHNYILSRIRGKKVAMIFQEPFLALNPVLTIGDQISEAILLHSRIDIANAIIRREIIKESDMRTFLAQATALGDQETRRRIVNTWTRQFGFPQLESPINDLLNSQRDMEASYVELSRMVAAERTGSDVRGIAKARDYYKMNDEIFGMTLSLLETESRRNNEDSLMRLIDRLLAEKTAEGQFRALDNWTRQFGYSHLDLVASELIGDNTAFRPGLEYLKKASADAFAAISENQEGRHDRKLTLLDASLLKQTSALLEKQTQETELALGELKTNLRTLKNRNRSQNLSFIIKQSVLRRIVNRPFVKEARRRTLELLQLVNIAEPTRVIDAYPHELSGGMQQRAMIAMALSSNPKMLIADEPTTALDVTTQAQILDLIKDLRNLLGSSVLFITHDLAVIAEMCDRVGVMYAGSLIEEGSVDRIFFDAKHPYTKGLLSAIPKAPEKGERFRKMASIQGTVPNLIKPPPGCRFHPRCSYKMNICEKAKPKLVDLGNSHMVACFLYSNEAERLAEQETIFDIPGSSMEKEPAEAVSVAK